MAFAYLRHLQESAAPPLRSDSFLKGCHLAYGLCGLTEGHKIASSARCRGLAAVTMADKRRRLQRDPLQMK